MQTPERELKLDAPESFVLPDLPGQPLEPRLFTSTYHDTADGRLARARITLRRRVEDGTSRWQLKLPRDDYRLEVEARGGRATAPPAFREALSAVTRGAGLRPVATLRTRREGVRAQDGTALADVVLDVVEVLEGRRVVGGFRELEVELVDGDPATLCTLGKRLRRAGAEKSDGRSKLLRTLGVTPLAAPAPKAPAADHLHAFLQRQLVALLSHDVGVRLGGPPEEVHQFRVATRRLRAALRVASPIVLETWAEPLRDELGWLGDELGRVRDLDVLADRLREQAGELGDDDRAAFEPLLATLEQERAEHAAELGEALRSSRYHDLVAALEAAAAQPAILDAERPAAELARPPFRRLRKALGRLGPDATDEELHRARILAKRARYAAELAQPAAGKRAAKFVRRAKELQDLLGEHQDATVAEERLRRLTVSADPAGALAAGRLVECQRLMKERARAELPAAARRLEQAGAKAWL
jgi:CHAD domain-containing protein